MYLHQQLTRCLAFDSRPTQKLAFRVVVWVVIFLAPPAFAQSSDWEIYLGPAIFPSCLVVYYLLVDLDVDHLVDHLSDRLCGHLVDHVYHPCGPVDSRIAPFVMAMVLAFAYAPRLVEEDLFSSMSSQAQAWPEEVKTVLT